MLAGMIEPCEGRIVAVVGGDDAIIGWAHRRFDLAESRVEGFETGGVAGDVAAMAPFSVEIDQIDEDEPPFEAVGSASSKRSMLPSLSLPLRSVAGVVMGEDVADLADRDDRATRVRGPLQQVAVGRGHREILAIGGADEIPALAPTKGRAMTRPIFSLSQSLRAMRQSS